MRVRWIVTSAVLAVTVLCWLLSHHSFRNNHSESSDGKHLRDDFYLNRQSVTQWMEKRKETSDYDVEDVVRCFDRLSVQRKRRPMRIAFVGDSTVRNHFLTFLRLFPDYDRRVQSKSTKFAEYYFHEDRNIIFPLLDNLTISFRWRHLIRSDLIDDFKHWSSVINGIDYANPAPDFLVLGVTLHHVKKKNNVTETLEEYANLFERELLPHIRRSLAVHPQMEIVWLHQSYLMDWNGPSGIALDRGDRNIFTDKIRHYNQRIRQVFRNTRVIIWDSVNIVVEEYLRSCGLARIERWDSKEYFNCLDPIHPGFGTLAVANQLLIRHICHY